MINKPWDIELLRSHWENGWWSWNNTSEKVFQLIEWGNSAWIDFDQFKKDMIKNETPRFDLSDFSFHWHYDKRIQLWREDIEDKSSLSKRIDDYGIYIYCELYDLKEKVEAQFTSFFSQKHISYNIIEDLIQAIDRVIIHIAQQIHPYQWNFLKQNIDSFLKDLHGFVDGLYRWTHVYDVVEEIYGWVYFHENGWIIWEWLRNLQIEESKLTSKHIQWMLDEIAEKYNYRLRDVPLSNNVITAVQENLKDT